MCLLFDTCLHVIILLFGISKKKEAAITTMVYVGNGLGGSTLNSFYTEELARSGAFIRGPGLIRGAGPWTPFRHSAD